MSCYAVTGGMLNSMCNILKEQVTTEHLAIKNILNSSQVSFNVVIPANAGIMMRCR